MRVPDAEILEPICTKEELIASFRDYFDKGYDVKVRIKNDKWDIWAEAGFLVNSDRLVFTYGKETLGGIMGEDILGFLVMQAVIQHDTKIK